MKKIVKLTEEKLQSIVRLVMEQVNLNDYDEEDFYDAFYSTFKQWINEKLGEDAKKYPFSYLLKKYGNEFEKDMGVGDGSAGDYHGYNKYRLIRTAKNLVSQGKYVLPSLNIDTKFTEKYKKLLPYFVEEMGIPEFVTVTFTEDEPNRVKVKFDVDFESMIRNEKEYYINADRFIQKLKDYLKNFVGVEFGNPAYGQVSMVGNLKYVGLEEWVKNVLNKKLKKEIKGLFRTNPIHAIKFEVYNGSADMRIIFSDAVGYGSRGKAIQEIRSYVENQGYNPKVFKVGY